MQKNYLALDVRMENNLIELQKSLVRNGVAINTFLSRILQNEQQITSIPLSQKLNLV